MTKKTEKPEKPVKPEPEKVEKKVKAEEPIPQYLIDIDNLQKTVAYLEDKAKSQGSVIHLMKSITDSCEGQIRDLHEKLKKVANVAGVII